MKIFVKESRENEFLSEKLENVFLQQGIDINNYIWFFIRYFDEKNHIRLRIKNCNSFYNIYKNIGDIFRNLNLNGFINYATIETYEPEVERYGGQKLIELAENIFMSDSILVLNIIKNIPKIQNEFSLVLISSLCIISMLDSFEMNHENKIEFLKKLTNKEKYIDEFRLIRKKVISLFINNNFIWHYDFCFSSISKYIEIRNQKIYEYNVIMNTCISSNELYNSKDEIITSFIHMHCNRLFGTSNELENKSISYALHILNSLSFHLKK
ncbi:thiopeptide-type bacteriocin biosynthesis protein [Pigmentibacter sp. JX0631]|uniref:thiopeptide-type bacteriocin biosynthesis protein n=1 Tax=Pigmentibacter sp. JX0631 TaxID=2976982 RepID=UPI002468F744|nr:thiopeptide-type bacteriocin biosynthesis protein [Pigmentibacter sp. JX0631]WGL61553.1 thiopeptide-type bacteriocin biosynthesis protein [Pigmentibacter sp. JX0631]